MCSGAIAITTYIRIVYRHIEVYVHVVQHDWRNNLCTHLKKREEKKNEKKAILVYLV